MVTRTDIADCYQKYRENMEREELIRERSLQAPDQEVWIKGLRNDSRLLRRYYVENEALLNLYIRPFLSGELRLTDPVAEEFLKQIKDYHRRGYDDELLCVDVAYLLEKYFSSVHNRDGLLWISHYLGNILNTYDTEESYQKSLEYFDRVRSAVSDYFEIEDWEIRRSILFAYYNYPVVIINCRKVADEGENSRVQKRLMREVARAAAIYDDPRIRRLDGDKYDLDGLKKELIHDVYGNWVCGMARTERLEGEFALQADLALTELYRQSLAENPDPYAMSDTIYCNYWKCQYVCGKISLSEFMEHYMGYCRYIKEHEKLDEKDFVNCNYYRVCMYDIPNVLDQAEDLAPEERRKVADYCFKVFRDFVKELPRTRSASYVNASIIETLCQMLPYLSQELFDFRFLLEITVHRDCATLIHSIIVQQLALSWLQDILEREPELLIGVLDTANVIEVLDQRSRIETYLSEAALVYDIGQIGLTNVVNCQIRSLNEREWERLRTHTALGGRIAAHARCLEQYLDVILGHHKSYDGKSGYPADYDNTRSKVRILTEIIRICDSMEAATDAIGRGYRHVRSLQEVMDELALGRGQFYHPGLVDFLRKDEALQEKMNYICTAGRNRVYYEVYSDFVSDRAENGAESFAKEELDRLLEQQSNILDDMQERGLETERILKSLSKASMLIGQICLRTDRLKIFHRGKDGWFADLDAESFHGFIGDYLRRKMPEESWQQVKALLRYGTLLDRLVEGNGMFEMEAQLAEGSRTCWVRLQYSVAEEENGVPVGLTLVIWDIDEARRKREQMETALKLAYQQAVQANQAKSIFFSNMSHDIRTPMNAIMGMTQIASMHLGDADKVAECLKKIQSASSHLLELINQVLDMSRIESGKIELEEKPLNLQALIQDMLMMIQPDAQKKQHTLRSDLSGLQEPLVYGDSARIQQIFLNLMSNAVKYTPDGGEISFTAKALPEKNNGYRAYQFIFADNGIGMSAEFMEKIFEPFSREEKAETSKIQGTGLGLSITRTLANMMQGSITVESAPGKGSCFTVILRLKVQENGQEKESAPAPGTEPQKKQKSLKGCRVLLVEDNEINREILKELLASTELLIDEAENGRVAVECVAAHEPGYYRLIFMDVQMPVMNGYEAAGQIRRLEGGQGHVPIVALTANAFAEDMDKAMASGMDGYLSKPIDMDKVMETLQHWI